MITIDQLLESVDLDFEPRFITKDEWGAVLIWSRKPTLQEKYGAWVLENSLAHEFVEFNCLKLAEFDGKDWTECIYEVPRKTTGNEIEQKMLAELERKLNAIVDAAIDAVNELKSGSKNVQKQSKSGSENVALEWIKGAKNE